MHVPCCHSNAHHNCPTIQICCMTMVQWIVHKGMDKHIGCCFQHVIVTKEKHVKLTLSIEFCQGELLDKAMIEGKMGWDSLFLPTILTKSAIVTVPRRAPLKPCFFESHSPALAWTFYYDQTESQGGKKYSILMICIDKIPNFHQIGKLCTLHKRTHMIFMNSICNLC